MNSDFEPPPKNLSILATVGGVVTAVIAIALLNSLSKHLATTSVVQKPEISASPNPTPGNQTEDIAQLDAKSMVLAGQPISPDELKTAKIPYIASETGTLTADETAIARQAWLYFQRNWNNETGLVNSVDGFASVTMWDQAAAIAALVSARELQIITPAEFDDKMSKMLKNLASMPLYKGELPNKVYNSQTLIPVNYGQLDKKEEIGWSALDLGRLAIWLRIVGAKYPQMRSPTEAVWKHWQVKRLVKNGQMYGTSVVSGKEQYNQEGRLGYENYAAFGLKLWGLDVKPALDYQSKTAFVNLYGQGVPYDKRDYKNSGANNYVLSEPYILDGIETGFQALPKAYSDRILAAQEARYQKTKILTAVTEDNLDRAPYFVYSSLFVNGEPWATITDTGTKYNNLRFLSAKAAIGWHVLYNTDYTRQLSQFVQTNLKSDKGWYNGFYESLNQPNQALTANNNGVILESLLYKKVGKPLTVWSGITTK
ncbi:DUF3131 domain-containing protein [Trichormus variabilis]|uniref:DUF3131 domain-containing protein n=1 Tax=Trichormus variabilis SAG 1403-4b TaxID=447716 RepID=A0A433US87_ANAVA|nr:DUF3131 domain-containing protein [Trichormus variabilis]MBD2627993.1 DUF3131 domain-containing protein [Trichormus variabilis FACHB-164]RUS96708.1 hypothetical protein DSM107003_21140 [Trichormus variabilis SAG 1403-4b]